MRSSRCAAAGMSAIARTGCKREISVQLGEPVLAAPPSRARARAVALVAPYEPPAFVPLESRTRAPTGRVPLAMTPTPLWPLDLDANLQSAVRDYLPSSQPDGEAERLAASVRWSIKVRS